ncbi:MAG: hypothetical protein ACMUIU_09125 [bacterium]
MVAKCYNLGAFCIEIQWQGIDQQEPLNIREHKEESYYNYLER